jgi:plastocyanin
MRRRDFIRTAGGVAGTAAAATAASGSAVAATENGATHTVEMEGVQFTPDRIEVAPGDTVVFENVGQAGHSVTAYEDSIPEGADYWASGGFDSEDAARDAYTPTGSLEDTGNVAGGESWSYTFETEGTHKYFCKPHEAADMVGEVVVTENPSAVTPGGTVTPGGNGTMTPGGNGTMAPGGSGGGGTTHTVDMTDGLVFDPDSLTIAPGDTVVFENVGGVGHSVTAYEDSIPEGATYWASGGFDSEDAARSAYSATGGIEDSGNVAGGESWSHTFETEGVHEYFCIPHEAAGMVGEIEVAAESGGGGGGGGEINPEHMGVPFQAHWVGIATLLGIGLTLLLTFFFLKYGETPHSGYPEER